MEETVQERVIRALSELINKRPEEISPTASFAELDMDSLCITELTPLLEQEFSISVDDKKISSFLSLDQVITYMESLVNPHPPAA